MKNNLYQSIFAFVVCLALFSCNSENEPKNEHQATVETEKDTVLDLSAYNSKKEQNVQTFEINTSKQQIIKGKQGTIVTFPADCFGKVSGKVKIELIECYSIQEMLLHGLSTQTTDGMLLESDGMIYLNALNEKGDLLEIKNRKVKVQMPTKQKKTDIEIFEGAENSNRITWNLSTEKLIVENGAILKNQYTKEKNEFTQIKNDNLLYQNQPKPEQTQIVIDKQIKNENLVNYVFNISKLGWINCDRYIEGKTQELFVNIPSESVGASYYLVLENYNSSVLPKKTNDGKLSFMLPLNEPYTIVALSSKGEEIFFNMQNYKGGEREVYFSELYPITRQGLLDKLLEKFGKDIWSRPLA